MQIKCGTDIIEVARIQKAIEKLGDEFKNKIYTKQEIKYCEERNKTKYQSYAVRFAAKEAIYKALSEKIDTLEWNKIEITKNKKGRPEAHLLQENIKCKIDISLSHTKQNAIATCVIVIE